MTVISREPLPVPVAPTISTVYQAHAEHHEIIQLRRERDLLQERCRILTETSHAIDDKQESALDSLSISNSKLRDEVQWLKDELDKCRASRDNATAEA